jgi:hypothetical protein
MIKLIHTVVVILLSLVRGYQHVRQTELSAISALNIETLCSSEMLVSTRTRLCSRNSGARSDGH